MEEKDLHTIDIGLGMNPDLTGQGKGADFLRTCLAFVKDKLESQKITLSVATFNQRTIKVYKNIGFQPVNTFLQKTNGDVYEFMKMIYHVKNER